VEGADLELEGLELEDLELEDLELEGETLAWKEPA
jgi:hypothetical protein